MQQKEDKMCINARIKATKDPRWWKQGVEVENGWEWVWDEWNHEKKKKKKKKKSHCQNSKCIWHKFDTCKLTLI